MPPATDARESRVAARKRKLEALEAAKVVHHVAQKPRRDEIALASDHLTCPICREIFENAVETACSHVYCENCVAIQMANGNRKCAVCRAPIRSSDLRPSVPIRRIVSDMDTTCTNAACKWKVACEYGHEKCGTMRRMDLKRHHVSECLFFICKCPLKCGQNFTRRDLSKHKKVCPNARAKCERCGQSVRRKELPHHAEHVCPKSKILCFAGCKGKMLREQLSGHILSNLGPHLCALATSSRIAEGENKKLSARLAEQEKAMVALAETVAELRAKRRRPRATEESEGAEEEEEEDDNEEGDAADGGDSDEASDEDVDADGSAGVSTVSGSNSDDDDEENEEEVEEGSEEEEEEGGDSNAVGSDAGSGTDTSSADTGEEDDGERYAIAPAHTDSSAQDATSEGGDDDDDSDDDDDDVES
ncbi:hypothetical protein T492DRAFT_955558 [Pavlovales sp. CCMP2436]|nr:hypothetical protein T492DRAFT_955558 [Pavlovales sp. CCMP2436]